MYFTFEFHLHSKQRFFSNGFCEAQCKTQCCGTLLAFNLLENCYSDAEVRVSQKRAFLFYDAKCYGKLLRIIRIRTSRTGWFLVELQFHNPYDSGFIQDLQVSRFLVKQQEGLSSAISWRCHQFQKSQASRKICRFTKFPLKDISNVGIYNASQTPSSFNQQPIKQKAVNSEPYHLCCTGAANGSNRKSTPCVDLPFILYFIFWMKTKSFIVINKKKNNPNKQNQNIIERTFFFFSSLATSNKSLKSYLFYLFYLFSSSDVSD